MGQKHGPNSRGRECLRRFERKVLRKIYGPVVAKGVWRIRYNNELCKLMGGEDI